MERVNLVLWLSCVLHRKFSSSSWPPRAGSNLPCQLLFWQSKMPSDIPKCPLEEKPTPGLGWFENHWTKGKSMPTAPWQWHHRSGELHMTRVTCLGAGTIQGMAKSEAKGVSKNQITRVYHNPQWESGLYLRTVQSHWGVLSRDVTRLTVGFRNMELETSWLKDGVIRRTNEVGLG